MKYFFYGAVIAALIAIQIHLIDIKREFRKYNMGTSSLTITKE